MIAATASPSGFGTRIAAANLAQLENREFNRIHRALLDHMVLVIDRQSLSAGEFAGFAARFGEPQPPLPAQFRHPGHPHVLVMSNAIDGGKPRGLADTGNGWHTDHSCLQAPAAVTAQYALEIPRGGCDSLFANMAEVYDALPEPLKRQIAGLQGIHRCDGRHPHATAGNADAAPPEVLHPIVRIHPDSGRRALYVNPLYTAGIKGLGQAAGDALKAELFSYALRPEFHYRHRWQPGDVVIWDDRCAMHCDTCDAGANWTFYRVMVAEHG